MNPKARHHTSLPTIQNTNMWQDPHKPSHTVGDFSMPIGKIEQSNVGDFELSTEHVSINRTNSEIGRKFDNGKVRYSLVPPYALESVARNLTVGLSKYSAHNWQKVPNAKERYLDALYRHLEAYRKGEINDPESSVDDMPHLAAVIANAMFLLEFDLNPNLEEVKE